MLSVVRVVDVWFFAAPANIPSQTLTHILYAFADTDSGTGVAKLSDPSSDQQTLKQVCLTPNHEVGGLPTNPVSVVPTQA